MPSWLPLLVGLCVLIGIVCVGLLLARVWRKPEPAAGWPEELPEHANCRSILPEPARPEIWDFPQFRSRWRPRRPFDQSIDG